MSVSPPGDPGAGEQDARPVRADRTRETQVGDHGTQDNHITEATAGRDAFMAGRDLHVQNVQVCIEAVGGGIPGGLRPDRVATLAGPAARSVYLEQVRRIAPPVLRDRDRELAELAWFCLDPEAGSYVWWRAGPWAGKSALLSWFVLRPPAEVAAQVRIVSFFITARLGAQDTRDAFTEVLAQQLAVLTGQSLPAVLPESTREAYLLDLLSQAANACAEAGGRLVLVVDGLDEDRGVITGRRRTASPGCCPLTRRPGCG
jgi:hypothetical protein